MDFKFAVLMAVILLGFTVNIVLLVLFERSNAKKIQALRFEEMKMLGSMLGVLRRKTQDVKPEQKPPVENREMTADEKEIARLAELERKKRERNYRNFFSYDGTPQRYTGKQEDDE